MMVRNFRKGCRLIQDFIVPSLDKKTYGELLNWTEEFGVFSICWTHKAKQTWDTNVSAVFLAWDRMKGRPMARHHKDFVNSKQRLRAAFRNIKTIKEMDSNAGFRKYKITDLDPVRHRHTEGTYSVPPGENNSHSFASPPSYRTRRKMKVEPSMYEEVPKLEDIPTRPPIRSSKNKTPRRRRRRGTPKKTNRWMKAEVENDSDKENETDYPAIQSMTNEDDSPELHLQESYPCQPSTSGALHSHPQVPPHSVAVNIQDQAAASDIQTQPSTSTAANEPSSCEKTTKKIPRELIAILSQTLDFWGRGCQRKSKVSQESWAYSLVSDMRINENYMTEQNTTEPRRSLRNAIKKEKIDSVNFVEAQEEGRLSEIKPSTPRANGRLYPRRNTFLRVKKHKGSRAVPANCDAPRSPIGAETSSTVTDSSPTVIDSSPTTVIDPKKDIDYKFLILFQACKYLFCNKNEHEVVTIGSSHNFDFFPKPYFDNVESLNGSDMEVDY